MSVDPAIIEVHKQRRKQTIRKEEDHEDFHAYHRAGSGFPRYFC